MHKKLEKKLRKVVRILPEAQVEIDNYGQIVIYTNIAKTDQGLVKIDIGQELNDPLFT